MAWLSIVIAAPPTPFDLVRPSSLGRLETKNGRFVSLACPALQIERPELESEPTTTTTPYPPPLDNPSLQEGGLHLYEPIHYRARREEAVRSGARLDCMHPDSEGDRPRSLSPSRPCAW